LSKIVKGGKRLAHNKDIRHEYSSLSHANRFLYGANCPASGPERRKLVSKQQQKGYKLFTIPGNLK
jgi:hypothetical protein